MDEPHTKTAPRKPAGLDQRKDTPAFLTMPKTRRFGRYELLAPLGEGGMGSVWVARAHGYAGVDRLVALKMLKGIPNAQDRKGLVAEARLTAKLHHKNIVSTLEAGEAEGLPFVVMELIDGVPLTRLLRARRAKKAPLPVAIACRIAQQVATGLHAAHELRGDDGRPLGLVHRDVSPHNVLVAVDGRVLVSDFGIAKFEGADATSEGVVKGKVSYMSPEQASAGAVDRRSDLFALGSVFYEMLTLERPFTAENAARTLLRVVSHDPPPPEELVPGIPLAVSRVLMRCLCKDAAARYASTREFEEALREAMRDHPSRADEEDVAQLIREDFPDLGQPLFDRLGRLAPELHAGTGTTLGMSAENSAPERSSVLRRFGLAAVAALLVATGLVFAGRRTVDTGGGASTLPAVSVPAQPAPATPSATAAASVVPNTATSAPAPKPNAPSTAPPQRSAQGPRVVAPTTRPTVQRPPSGASAPAPIAGPKPFESL